MYISNLIIETTRKCNMSCLHCLRGDTENINMKKEYIFDLLMQVEDIGSITFSGGEPSLNHEIIDYTLKICKENNICVNNFYIATNGINVKEEFIISCLKWYAYCEEKDMCMVQVSNDEYHYDKEYDTMLLDGLSFFSRKHSIERDSYILINEGRAIDNYADTRENKVYKINSQEDFDDSEIYLNCNGKIINGCNWSYTSQDNNIICDANKLSDFYNELIEVE